MKGWENIESRQPEVTRFLVNSHAKNRLVHAYIFEGVQGVGKLTVAKNVAKMLLCEESEPICCECRHCQLVESEGHVNVHYIRPDGLSIKKEQIQQLQVEFSKRAAEDLPKIYVIEEADKMSTSAANSLLKFLEEPMPNTYAILLTDNKQKLLPTIRSRSVILSFKSLSVNELIQNYEAAGIHAHAAIVATLTQNLNEALALTQAESFTQLIELAIKTEECFSKTNFDPSVLVSKHSALLKEKKNQLLYLQLLMIYYEDVLKLKLGKRDDIRFTTYESALSLSESQMTQVICLERIKALLETEKRIQSNGNVLLCLDRLFLQMKGGI